MQDACRVMNYILGAVERAKQYYEEELYRVLASSDF